MSTFLREWGMDLFQTPLVTEGNDPLSSPKRSGGEVRGKGDGINLLPNSYYNTFLNDN